MKKTVILCGGSGTRLWPLSRTLYPKQFYPLFDGHSLFQKTVKRNQEITDEYVIVVNEEQYFMAQDQFNELGLKKKAHFMLEPIGRNTAAAIALAAFAHQESTLLVLPSDHLIEEATLYQKAIDQAHKLSMESRLVTFGITPTHPETGYGYIKTKGQDVEAFVEKPDQITAQSYLDSGDYFWNSGMFCFKATIFLNELKEYRNDIYQATQKTFEKKKSYAPTRFEKDLMEKIPSESIDYAVMEKSNRISLVPTNFKWSDVGSFEALYEALPHDKMGNTLYPNHVNIDSKNNLILGKERLIATIGLEDIMIVDSPDALLVAKKGRGQEVKKIVSQLKETNPELTSIHQTAHRPWGHYTVLEDQPGFKVKSISVHPGARLSLQKHHKRSEHWVVVKGVATVTLGEKTFDLKENESTYISIGEVHRLENKTQEPLIIVEAQVGSYLGEDDIIRLKDDYKRD